VARQNLTQMRTAENNVLSEAGQKAPSIQVEEEEAGGDPGHCLAAV
jgi:hypothetical protein